MREHRHRARPGDHGRKLDSFRISYVNRDPATRPEGHRPAGVDDYRSEYDGPRRAGRKHQPVPGAGAGDREGSAGRARKEAGRLQAAPFGPAPLSALSEPSGELERAAAASGAQRIDQSSPRAATVHREPDSGRTGPGAGSERAASRTGRRTGVGSAATGGGAGAARGAPAPFYPDHPDVRGTERTITELKVKVAEENASPRPVAERPISAEARAHEQKLRRSEG